MKIIIEGTPEEIKKVLPTITNNKKQKFDIDKIEIVKDYSETSGVTNNCINNMASDVRRKFIEEYDVYPSEISVIAKVQKPSGLIHTLSIPLI